MFLCTFLDNSSTLLRVNDSFASEFGGLFLAGAAIADGEIYRVARDGESAALEAVPG